MQFQSPRFTITPAPPKPRLAQLYGVGSAKSGTHSIAELFGPPLRSFHEPEVERTIDFVLAKEAGQLSQEQVRDYLLARDRRLRLDVEASHVNVFFVAELAELFPLARFVLTIREPLSWLDSFINHQLSYPTGERWQKLRDLRFQPERYPHGKGEEVLAAKGLYSLDGYFSYWARHQRRVLEAVPQERLLILRTSEIGPRAAEIATFAGVSPETLREERSVSFPAKEKHEVLAQIDAERLAAAMQTHCGELAARFFPNAGD